MERPSVPTATGPGGGATGGGPPASRPGGISGGAPVAGAAGADHRADSAGRRLAKE